MCKPFRRLNRALLFFIALPLGLLAEQPAASAPMELRRNHPFVQVMVNGKGPFTFGIDTGTAAQALAFPSLIQKLGLPVTGETEMGDPSGKNTRKVPTVLIDSVQLAGIEFKKITAAETDPLPGLDDGTDGTLGFGLFREYLLTLDYPHQQVTLARGILPPADRDRILPFRMPDDIPVVELTIGSQTVAAHLDSRGMGLSLPERVAQSLKFAADPVLLGKMRTPTSEFEIKGAQLASDIQLGGYTFSKPFIEINPAFPVANFGSSALRNFSVTFDQKNKLVQFLAGDKTITISPPPMMRMPPPGSQPQPAPGSGPGHNE